MAIVVEDGTGIEAANSFISRADMIEQGEALGVELADDETTDAMILAAGIFLLGINDWKGEPTEDLQGMPFPRTGLYVGSTLIADDAIPTNVVLAQGQLVLLQNSGTAINTTTDQAVVTQETIGPITTKYSDRYGATSALEVDDIPVVANLLGKYREQSFGFTTVRA